MKYQKSSSFLAIILSLLIVAMSVHATTLPTTITPDNLVLRDQYGKIVATSLNVALINNTDGYVQLARVLTESGTTFPTSPAVGYLYYRTDLQALYIYTGITWVTAMTATLPPGTISYNDLSDKPDMGVFLLENGTNVLTSNWNVGSYGIYGLTYVTSTLLTTSLLNVTSNFYGAGSFWWNNQNRTDVLANPTSPYSYIIDVSGSTYRMKNGSDGQISYQSTNVTRVEQFALGNMTFGTLYLKQVQHNSSLTVPANVMVIEDYQGVLTYRTASMAQHIPASSTDNITGSYIYLGSLTSDPVSLVVGEMWYNSVSEQFKAYNGSIIVLSSGATGPAGPAGTANGLPYSYLIFNNATSNYMVNGTTGSVDYQSTNATKVWTFAIVNASSGGAVCGKAGTYTLSGAIQIASDANVVISGEGEATILNAGSGAGAKVFEIIDGATHGFDGRYVTIENMQIQATNGYGIFCDNSAHATETYGETPWFTLQNLLFTNIKYGMRINTPYKMQVSHIRMRMANGVSNSIGIWLMTSALGNFHCGDSTFSDIYIDGSMGTNTTGILIDAVDSATSATVLNLIDFIGIQLISASGSGTGIWLNANDATKGNIQYINFIGIHAIEDYAAAIKVDGRVAWSGSYGQITNIHFRNFYISGSTNDYQMTGKDSWVYFDDGIFDDTSKAACINLTGVSSAGGYCAFFSNVELGNSGVGDIILLPGDGVTKAKFWGCRTYAKVWASGTSTGTGSEQEILHTLTFNNTGIAPTRVQISATENGAAMLYLTKASNSTCIFMNCTSGIDYTWTAWVDWAHEP